MSAITTGIVVLGSPGPRITLSSSRPRATAPAPAPSSAVVAEAPAEGAVVKWRRRQRVLPRYLPRNIARMPRRRRVEKSKEQDDDWCPSRGHVARCFEDMLRGGELTRKAVADQARVSTYAEEYRRIGWDSRDEKVARESRVAAYAQAAAKFVDEERERRRELEEREALARREDDEKSFLVLPRETKIDAPSRKRVVSRVSQQQQQQQPGAIRTRVRRPRPTELPSSSRGCGRGTPSQQWRRREKSRERTTDEFVTSMSELILKDSRGAAVESEHEANKRHIVESHAKLMKKFSSSLMSHDDCARTTKEISGEEDEQQRWLNKRYHQIYRVK